MTISNKYEPSIPRLATIMMMVFALSGCGIKPGSLDAPEGSDAKTFPRTYPAPDQAK